MDAPRRLQSFRDPTLHTWSAFDSKPTKFDEQELKILNSAYTYLAKNLGSNLLYFKQSGMTRGDLVFDILDDREINAFASNKDGHDAIVLNAGLVLCLFFLYGRIAQYPTAFAWVSEPNSGSEEFPPPFDVLPVSINQIYSQQLKLLGDGPHLLDDVMARLSMNLLPVDENRRQFSLYLWKWSLLFILYHELGHLAHGHVDYFAAMHHGYSFSELGEIDSDVSAASTRRSSQVPKYEIRQSQERQADALAVALTFEALNASRSILPPYFSLESERGLNRIPYTWGFCLATIFTLLAYIERTVWFDRTGFTHPNPFERMGNAIARSPSYILEEYRRHLERGLKPLEAYEALGPQAGTLGEFMDAWRDLDVFLGMAIGPTFRGYFNAKEQVIPVNLSRFFGDEKEKEWAAYKRVKNLGKPGVESKAFMFYP